MKTSDTPEEQDELTSMWKELRDYEGNHLQENRDVTTAQGGGTLHEVRPAVRPVKACERQDSHGQGDDGRGRLAAHPRRSGNRPRQVPRRLGIRLRSRDRLPR